MLAISQYNATSDGNAIGFVRHGESFGSSLYELHHVRVHGIDSPSHWTRKLADCLADFVVECLDRD